MSVPSSLAEPPARPALIYEWHFLSSQLHEMRHNSVETARQRVVKAWQEEEVGISIRFNLATSFDLLLTAIHRRQHRSKAWRQQSRRARRRK